MGTIWREPAEESSDLYPGLCVDDDRQSGSITIGPTRLPLRAVITTAVTEGWEDVQCDWPNELTETELVNFLHDLLELRGEFGRLLLVLADAERCEHHRSMSGKAWWETKRHRRRVGDQLRRCLAALEQPVGRMND